MAQQLQEPVAICSTAGSATLNYAPTICEAYYQEIPLLILTADRPPEWIDQGEGQSINQRAIYQNYIEGSFNFPDENPDTLGKLEESQMKPSTYLKIKQACSYQPSFQRTLYQTDNNQKEKKLNCVKLKELLVKMK